MRKESKFSKIFRRDEIVRKKIVAAGFATFCVSVIFWPIMIIGELLNNEVTFGEVKYSLILIGLNLLLFIFALFLTLVAKKKHFNNFSALVLTAAVSVYFAIDMYKQGIQTWWLLIIGLGFIIVFTFVLIKYLFKGLSEDLYE